MAAFLILSDDAVIKCGMSQGLNLGGLDHMSRHSLASLHGSYATGCSDCFRAGLFFLP